MGIPFMLRIITVVLLVLMSSQAHAVVLKIATLSPEGSSWMEKMRQGAKEVAQKTNNRVRFKFYPGGVMGNDSAVLRKIRIGQLHGGALTAGSLFRFYTDCRVYSLPLKFQSFQEVAYVRERMDPLIIAGLEKGGFVTFGLAGGGFAYVMSNAPVRNIDELRKQKMWIPDNDSTFLETIKVFGIRPIPLPIAEVRTSLQTGLINTVAISPVGALVLQWHTQVKYLTEIPLVYVYGLLAVDRKAFSKIVPGNQKIVHGIMGRVFLEIDRQNREDNEKALEVLRKQGIQSIKPPPEMMSDWFAVASAVSKRLIEEGRLSQEILNILDRNLEDYRSKQSNESK